MPYTYDQLTQMNVTQLREIAKGVDHEAVHGFSTMHKEKLILALCVALGIEAHKHHTAVGINKTQIKQEIRKLKVMRDTALAASNHAEYKKVLRDIHHLKNKLRQAIR